MAEHVIELEVPFFDPEPNVPEPVVVQSERKCFLIYWNRDGERTAMEFIRCTVSKFGYPNNEALGGHKLYGKGLSWYGFFEVNESGWIAEMKEVNRVAFPNVEVFGEARHFVITFHDSTFECVASGFRIAAEFPHLESRVVQVVESF